MTTLEASVRPRALSQVDAPERKLRPVLLWAGIGAAILLCEAYVLGSWLLSAEFVRIPTGPDAVPGWMQVTNRVWETIAVSGTLAMVWFVLIRPWRRQRRITTDGMFVLAFMTVWWQDPLSNGIQNWFVYNSDLVNFGNFVTKIPFWNAPNSQLNAYPILFAPGTYISCVFGAVMLGNVALRKIKARWPRLGRPGLVMAALGMCITLDILAECIWLRFGVVQYGGSLSWASLFYGHYYQFPLAEGLAFGSLAAAWTCIRYFQNDRGETLVEHGIETVPVSQAKRSVLRCLAIIGVCQTCFLGYNAVMANVNVHQSAWPDDVLNRSYLMNGVCGPRTDYACPGPGVPIPGRHSAHLRPDGSLSP